MIALLALVFCADSAINYCAPLVPTPDLDSVTASLELVAPSGAFDVPMTKDGVFNYGLVIDAAGLPPASSLGPYTVYVAWATSLTMDTWSSSASWVTGEHRSARWRETSSGLL